jgi:hypothetical protein
LLQHRSFILRKIVTIDDMAWNTDYACTSPLPSPKAKRSGVMREGSGGK